MKLGSSSGADWEAGEHGARPAFPAEMLSVRDVAALLGGCSTRHVYRLADAGRMPHPFKLGALVRWRRTEVLNWIEAGCPSVRVARAAER